MEETLMDDYGPRHLLAYLSCYFLLCFLAVIPPFYVTSLRPYVWSLPPECFFVFGFLGSLALCELMRALIRPRPTKPVGRLFKLLLETACLQAALLLRHYYHYRTSNSDGVIWSFIFVLMVTASFQVYAVFFAFLGSPDLGVPDALFVVLMQSLVYWMPARGFFVTPLAWGLLIALRYHPSPPPPPHKSEQEKESSCWVIAHSSTAAALSSDYSNSTDDDLSAPFIC